MNARTVLATFAPRRAHNPRLCEEIERTVLLRLDAATGALEWIAAAAEGPGRPETLLRLILRQARAALVAVDPKRLEASREPEAGP